MAEPTITKFLFDRSFDEEAQAEAKAADAVRTAEEAESDGLAEEDAEPPAPTFTEEEVAAARQEGYAEGKGDGLREAATGIERRLADTLDGLSARLDEILAQAEGARDQTVQSGVSIALAILRKLFPELSRRGAAAEVEAIVAAALERGIEEPRLVIRVDSEVYGEVSERAHALAAARGFEGKVLVMEDADLVLGDCRIEWSDGGAERDSALLWQEIDEIIERNLNLAEPRGDEAAGSAAPGKGAEARDPADSGASPKPAPAGGEAPAATHEEVDGDVAPRDGVETSGGAPISPESGDAPMGDDLENGIGEMGGVTAEGMTPETKEE